MVLKNQYILLCLIMKHITDVAFNINENPKQAKTLKYIIYYFKEARITQAC